MANANVDPTHIKFGKSVYINPKMRLPQFDNGRSLAYQAYDIANKANKLIAIVAGAENIPRWSAVGIYGKLDEVSFMRLVGSGIVRWPLDNKQKYVFMYSGSIGECLVERGKFSDIHWRHPDIVEYFISPMVRMFKEMSDNNFFHGSICPSNIYYSASGNSDAIILGDGLSAQPGSTQDALFFPPSRALATPMGRGVASLSGDIYAFGVSLVVFLRKADPFAGLSDEDVVRRKIEIGSYATLVGNERFPASFLELLRGVLHDDEAQRWGLEELFSWLDGTRLIPASLTKKKKANRPLIFSGQKYLYAEFLAIDLHTNPIEVAQIVEDGSLSRWISTSIDDGAITERYEKAMERVANFSGDREYLVTQIAMALNPVLPIRYKGRCFTYDGLGAMMVETIFEKRDLECYKEILNLNLPDQALGGAALAQNEMMSYLKLYDVCRASLRRQKIGYGIEKCIYLLCKDAPCLSPKLDGYFVNGAKSVVLTFEAMCKQGGQVSLMLDQHLVAFFSVLNASFMDDIIHDLSSSDKDSQIAGNLRFMATMQKKSGITSVPAMAGVFLSSLSGVYKAFNNRKMQQVIKEGVEKAAAAGNLTGMSLLLDDETALARDKGAFRIASAEYKMLVNEYNDYNRKLSNKKTYGIVNGHDAAAIVSWLASTVITVIVVLAFISGNRIF